MLKMKGLRHSKIKDIIDRSIIETQEELAEALRKEGIEITQATVSRDIKELMLIKVPTGDGRYRYAFPIEQNILFSQARMERIFRDAVTSIDFSENLIVIKTLPGTANAVASTVDYAKWPEIIGTIAGDDNILIIAKPASAVPALIARFQNLLHG